jgi:Flp pilus assembly protein TadG
VEFAFVAPVFFMLVLGLIELGRGMMVTHELTSAARDGCRVGVIQGKTDTDIKAAVSSALSAQGISGYSTTIRVNDVVPSSFSIQSNDQLTVQVSVPVSNVTWLPGGQYLSGSLTGRFTLRRE